MYRYLLAHLLSNRPRINVGTTFGSASVILVAIAISGCGNKGDLYLPEDVSTTYQGSSYKSSSYQAPSYKASNNQTSNIQRLANHNKD
ncbi:MAG: lipoprotein [Porticoccaceae bacterium]|jgi:predicted small lipoprotein YifL|nr:lipoprotein [Porticoccaceae bacterium]MBT6592322.1 lipoprotein [Porticoccaceae bacterium]